MQALDTLLKREKSPVFGYATLMKNRIEELKKAPLPKIGMECIQQKQNNQLSKRFICCPRLLVR